MKIIVVGKTDCIITLNKIGMPIHGKQQALVEIDNDEKKNEILGLKRAGLLDIIEVNIAEEREKEAIVEIHGDSSEPNGNVPYTKPEDAPRATETPVEPINLTLATPPTATSEPAPESKKNKGGRPRGSKNKKAAAVTKKTEQERVVEAEAKTQKMGARVVISTGNGSVESKMRRTFEGEIPETETTKESINALEKIEKEEVEDKKQGSIKVDESNLDPSEQMGRQAVVVQEGKQNKKELSNSIIPGQKEIRDNINFIDENKKDKANDAFIDGNEGDDDIDFLKM